MFNLLKDTYDKAEDIKGKRLLYTLVAVFVVFILIGVLVGYFISPKLSKNEKNAVEEEINSEKVAKSDKVEVVGKIVYVNPERYPGENISYSITDGDGKDIYLLRSRSSSDERLKVSENLTVTITGKLEKLSDGKTPVLIVEEVTIKNVAN
jgi:predicted small secreted protein